MIFLQISKTAEKVSIWTQKSALMQQRTSLGKTDLIDARKCSRSGAVPRGPRDGVRERPAALQPRPLPRRRDNHWRLHLHLQLQRVSALEAIF